MQLDCILKTMSFFQLFNFNHQSLDEALRTFLQQFCLTGETQDRERVLLHFSKRFLECNPSLRGVTFQVINAIIVSLTLYNSNIFSLMILCIL